MCLAIDNPQPSPHVLRFFFFFFNDPPPPEIYPLPLPAALPFSRVIEYGITPPYGPATPSADMLAWAQTMVFAAVGRPPATFSDLDALPGALRQAVADCLAGDRKSTRLNSSHSQISYAVFCLKKK